MQSTSWMKFIAPMTWLGIVVALNTNVAASDEHQTSLQSINPHHFAGCGFLAIDVLLDKTPVTMWVSTGMQDNFIDRSLEKVCATATNGGRVPTFTRSDEETSTFDSQKFRDVAVVINGQNEQHDLISMDLSGFGFGIVAGPQGTLGMNALKSHVLSFRHRGADVDVQLSTSVTENTVHDQRPIRMKLNKNNIPLVSVHFPILGSRDMLVNTGQNMSVTVTPVCAGILMRAGEAVFRDSNKTVDGDNFRMMETIVIREVECLGVTFQNVPAQIQSVNSVGMGILRHFDITMDFPHQITYFKVISEGERRLNGLTRSIDIAFRDPQTVVVISESTDLNIKPGDQLLELQGKPASAFTYWQIGDILDQTAQPVRCRVQRGETVFDLEWTPKSRFEPPKSWSTRKALASEFYESLKQ